MKLKLMQAALVAAGMMVLGAGASSALAQSWTTDSNEIRQDRRELREDYRELARDRAEYQQARASGDYRRMAQERREIRQDMAEINRDRAELRHDLRERRQDQRAHWGNHQQEHRSAWNSHEHRTQANWNGRQQEHQPQNVGQGTHGWQGQAQVSSQRPTGFQPVSTTSTSSGTSASQGNNGLHRGWQTGRGNPHRG